MTNKPKDYSYIFELNDEDSLKKREQYYNESNEAAIEIIANAHIYLAAMDAIRVSKNDLIEKSLYIKNQILNCIKGKKDIEINYVAREKNPVEVLLYRGQIPSNLPFPSDDDNMEDEKSLQNLLEIFENKMKDGYSFSTMEIAENVARVILNDRFFDKKEYEPLKLLVDEEIKKNIQKSLYKLDFVGRCDKALRPVYEKIKEAKRLKEEAESKAKKELIEKARKRAEEKKAEEEYEKNIPNEFSRLLTLYDIANNRYAYTLNNASNMNLTDKQKRACAVIEEKLNKINKRVDSLGFSPYSLVVMGKDEKLLIDKDGFYCIDPNASKKLMNKFIKSVSEKSICECYDGILEVEDCLKPFMLKGQIMTI